MAGSRPILEEKMNGARGGSLANLSRESQRWEDCNTNRIRYFTLSALYLRSYNRLLEILSCGKRELTFYV